ncbi:MAG TPA: FAD-dependent oxidoreductase [Candidatus Paceibacterota bacterium]|nr:FAD-dependent oxidoreductase [Candidatus Paceibacterota bacterium]
MRTDRAKVRRSPHKLVDDPGTLNMGLWWSEISRPEFSPGNIDRRWDVLIVGGGFSGLWSAHHLISNDPSLKIAIVEKDRVGSGASGRNGGWASALYPASDETLLTRCSQSQVDQLHTLLRVSIDEIGQFVKSNRIECGFQKSGALIVARNGGQLRRLQIESNTPMLSQEETLSRIAMSGAVGSFFTPDCAVLNPAALVVGLAKSLEARGVAIFENTSADISRRRKASVNGRSIKAKFIIRAVEAYHEKTRDQIPIYSLMIATEPLPAEVFEVIGIRNREAFAEASHLVTYAQRTADNRLAIGGRGAPYTWGSKRNEGSESHEKDHERLRIMAREWFPVLKDFEFTHAWGGAVGVTRDWAPYVRTWRGFGEMGGYAGDGVTLSYLAAAAMADLVTKEKSVRTSLPFVHWRNPRWEREPLRWLAVNGAIKLSALADKEERITHRPSRIMKLLAPLTGQ